MQKDWTYKDWMPDHGRCVAAADCGQEVTNEEYVAKIKASPLYDAADKWTYECGAQTLAAGALAAVSIAFTM